MIGDQRTAMFVIISDTDDTFNFPRIYKSVMNKEFEDPEWIGSEAYGHTEWDILRKTCSDMFPEEELSFELLYSLIDTENQAIINPMVNI